MKLLSWNVNGIRAVAKKGLIDILHELDADIVGFQETKAQGHQVEEALTGLKGYHIFHNEAEKKGYSGTAIISKKEPLSVKRGIGIAKHDNEGRVLTAEFDDFYFVTVYVPNSQGELKRLPYRQQWDKDFLAFLLELKQKKNVVVCGDMNVAHQPIDLKNPKSNFNKTAGYTEQEIEGMDNYLRAGFTDTFRYYYPDEIKYSWWSYRFSARKKNIGWRIDYFLVNDEFLPHVKDAFILNEVMGSDHCPVGILVE